MDRALLRIYLLTMNGYRREGFYKRRMVNLRIDNYYKRKSLKYLYNKNILKIKMYYEIEVWNLFDIHLFNELIYLYLKIIYNCEKTIDDIGTKNN